MTLSDASTVQKCTNGVVKAISGSLISALALFFLMPRSTLQEASFEALTRFCYPKARPCVRHGGLASKGHARDETREFQTARDNGKRQKLFLTKWNATALVCDDPRRFACEGPATHYESE